MLNESKDYLVGLIGCIGNDEYGKIIKKELENVGVSTDFVEINSEELSSRCGCGILKKERCLMPQIRASSKLNLDFVKKNIDNILKYSILFVEGYFLIECWDIVKYLCNEFKNHNKKIAFTLSAVFMVEFHWNKIKELAEMADMIFCNEEEAAAFVKMSEKEVTENDVENSKKIHQSLPSKKRTLIVTCGKHPVIVSEFDYDKNDFKNLVKAEVKPVPNDEIVDTNGCGDSFVGGFMSQYLHGSDLEKCALAGNYASSVVIRNVGCTFPSKQDFKC